MYATSLKLQLYKDSDNIQRINEVPASPKKYSLIDKPNKGVTVIILNLNAAEFIIPLLKQLKAQQQFFEEKNLYLEILIGDTGSTNKNVLSFYEKNHFFTVIPDLQYHFSKCNNKLAFEHATCDHYLFLNNDIIFPESRNNILYNLYNFTTNKQNVGCIGCYLFYQNQTIQHAGIDFFRNSCYNIHRITMRGHT